MTWWDVAGAALLHASTVECGWCCTSTDFCSVMWLVACTTVVQWAAPPPGFTQYSVIMHVKKYCSTPHRWLCPNAPQRMQNLVAVQQHSFYASHNSRLHLAMSPTQISPFLRAWYKWKSLRLPWRKRFLIGMGPIPRSEHLRHMHSSLNKTS